MPTEKIWWMGDFAIRLNSNQSAAQGGSFSQGFLSGAISSGISSDLVTATSFEQIIGGGFGGALGAGISGGNILHGFGQGIAVGAFNHALHSAVGGPGDPPTKEQIEQMDYELSIALRDGTITDNQYWLMREVLMHRASGNGNWSGILKQAFLNNKWDVVLSIAPGGVYIKGGAKILVKGTDNVVDLAKFSKGKYKHWRLVRDNADGKASAHGGSYYKLRNTHTNARYTLDVTGKVLRN